MSLYYSTCEMSRWLALTLTLTLTLSPWMCKIYRIECFQLAAIIATGQRAVFLYLGLRFLAVGDVGGPLFLGFVAFTSCHRVWAHL